MEDFEQGSSPALEGGGATQENEGQVTQTSEQPSVYDLDSAEKVKWQGREWTKDELSKSFMMQSDYTQKTQRLNEERKYAENFAYDLMSVLKNPSLAARFKQIYPQTFHAHVDAGLSLYKQLRAQGMSHSQAAEQTQDQAQGQSKAGLPDEFLQRFERLESQIEQTNLAKIEAQLDATFSKLEQKYPFADEEMVIARASALIDQGQKMSDDVWDKLWKSSHETLKGKADKHYSEQVNKQKQANQKGRDVGSGGGIPASAPKQPKSIKEATDMFLKEQGYN